MIDQHRSSVPENEAPHRSSSNPRKSFRNDNHKGNLPAGQVDIIAMVRSLQRSAGRVDCFRTGNADCDIIDCDWRTYCLGTLSDRKKNDQRTKAK